jgi:uncharacterized protein (DUF488 family)
MIIDVRANPISRKFAFSKKRFSNLAQNLGIRYKHVPELGIPSKKRAELSDFSSYQRLLDYYESEMLPKQKNHISEVARLMNQVPSALMCVEKDVQYCHRKRLASCVAEEAGLRTEHL